MDAHGSPDLNHHGIFAGAQKRFDLEVLLDPFKKQLHCITDDARMNRNGTPFNNFISGGAPLSGDMKDPLLGQ